MTIVKITQVISNKDDYKMCLLVNRLNAMADYSLEG